METLQKKNNCLSLFKLMAAIQVMYGHYCAHLNFESNYYFDILIGTFSGVPVFFTLSGLLIFFSLERSAGQEGYGKYLRKRFLRIYPELWVAIAIEFLCIFILYRGWNIRDMAVFAVTQGTLFQFWTPESLRGYGCGVPNGALWTIGITVQFYIIAWFLYKILKNRKWYVWLAALGTSILLGQLGNTVVDTLENETIKKLFGQTIVCYLWLFLLGMTVGHFFEQLIPFCRKWWIILIAAGIIIGVADIDLTIGYGLFRTPLILLGFLGFAYNFPKLKLKKDISFGIFIYHMIVANVMITFGWTGKFIYLLIATAVSCLLAYLSTITIGEYCAKKK